MRQAVHRIEGQHGSRHDRLLVGAPAGGGRPAQEGGARISGRVRSVRAGRRAGSGRQHGCMGQPGASSTHPAPQLHTHREGSSSAARVSTRRRRTSGHAASLAPSSAPHRFSCAVARSSARRSSRMNCGEGAGKSLVVGCVKLLANHCNSRGQQQACPGAGEQPSSAQQPPHLQQALVQGVQRGGALLLATPVCRGVCRAGRRALRCVSVTLSVRPPSTACRVLTH